MLYLVAFDEFFLDSVGLLPEDLHHPRVSEACLDGRSTAPPVPVVILLKNKEQTTLSLFSLSITL